MKLFVAGINHRTVSLHGRERYGWSDAQVRDLLPEIQTCPPVREVVLLSTCNRVEVYAVAERGKASPQELFGHVLRMAWPDMPRRDFAELQRGAYLHEGEDCVRHLFRVASGLDSQVQGETAITGQVKNAYADCLAAGATGTYLNLLFQKALAEARKVRNQTSFGLGSVSHGAIAVALAREHFGGDLTSRSILVVGAGRMARSVLHGLRRPEDGQVWIANRSHDKARDLADRMGFRPASLARARSMLTDIDLLITAASSREPLLAGEEIAAAMQSRPHRDLLVIDLGVPRNVDPAAGHVRGVRMLNIEDLGQVVERNRCGRSRAATVAESMVARDARRVAAGLQHRHEQASGVHHAAHACSVPPGAGP